jgi:hypothetical protein
MQKIFSISLISYRRLFAMLGPVPSAARAGSRKFI